MADILNPNSNPTNVASNLPGSNTNSRPPSPVVPTNTTSPATPTPVNTGSQYEVDGVAPEDLDMIWSRWKCLLCNYTYEGTNPARKCPRCGNVDPDKFEDAD